MQLIILWFVINESFYSLYNGERTFSYSEMFIVRGCHSILFDYCAQSAILEM